MWHDYDEEARPYSVEKGEMQFDEIADDNTIIHFIAGEHDPREALNVVRWKQKILVLGYKEFGRGIGHFSPRVAHGLSAWKYWIGTIISKGHVCFDNLAIKQLNLRERLPVALWDRCYMGDDGKFTMYADAVKDEFAISSTSIRYPASKRSAKEFFQSHDSLGLTKLETV